tara:strand:+ start:11552 stop:11824 length:273 start_codon:yes stop_codon:yes gene_type:complete
MTKGRDTTDREARRLSNYFCVGFPNNSATQGAKHFCVDLSVTCGERKNWLLSTLEDQRLDDLAQFTFESRSCLGCGPGVLWELNYVGLKA